MIGVKLQGRLGNQLFQYAFAYSSAKRMSTKFYLDKEIENNIVDQYFNIDGDLFQTLDNYVFRIRGYKNFFSHYLKRFSYNLIRSFLDKQEVCLFDNIPSAEEMRKIENFKMFKGYFQSEQFFKDYKKEILKQFTIKPKFVKDFENLKFKIPPSFRNVVVHIRRTDYISLGLELPLSYYKNAISLINNENNFYIFISDDPVFVETEFNYIENKHISKESEIIDFQFLMNADICIISNSTFSWWATYLNQKKLEVLAPNYWIKNNAIVESPIEIFSKDWRLVSP